MSHNLTSVICLFIFCLIGPIDRSLSGASIPGQSGPGSNGNEGVLHTSQIFIRFLNTLSKTRFREGSYHIYPTPPLGQDITRGHFLSGV